MLNNTETQSRPKLLLLVPAIRQTHKSLENSQDFFVKTKTMTKTLGLKTKTKTKTKTLFFVLEATRDQDFGLKDYITAASGIQQIPPYVQPRWTLASYRELRLRDRIFAVAGPHGFESVYQFTSSFPPLKTRYSQNSKDCF